jgi:hypothetical protein
MSIRQDSIKVEELLNHALTALMAVGIKPVVDQRRVREARISIREALDIVSEMRVPPRVKRSNRVAAEVALTGLEQALPL